ncbi:unnamed protein product, partial [Symbiodinium pilosum]
EPARPSLSQMLAELRRELQAPQAEAAKVEPEPTRLLTQQQADIQSTDALLCLERLRIELQQARSFLIVAQEEAALAAQVTARRRRRPRQALATIAEEVESDGNLR